MAKSKLTTKTEDNDLDAGNIKSIGLGLNEAEIAYLDELAAALGNGISRNKVLRWIVRRGLLDIKAGRVDLNSELTVKTEVDLKLPTE